MNIFKRSLKERAFLGITAVFLPIFITFFLSYHRNKAFLEKRVLDTVTIIAEAKEGQIYQFLEKAKQRAQDFASDGFIRSQLLRRDREKKLTFDTLSNHLIKNKLTLSKSIKTIHVLSPEGRIIASTDNAEIGNDFSNESFFIKGKDAVTVVESYTVHMGLPELAISAPIFSKDTGRLIGVIVNFIRISELDPLLSGEYHKELGAISWGQEKGAWNTLEVYLVNRDKLMITKSLFVKDAILKQIVDTPPVNLCLTSNKEMSGFYKDYRGVEVVGASMYIPSMKWVLLIEIDKSEVLIPIKKVLISVIITAVVVIAMVALLFFAFLKRVVKPLKVLSDAAEDIAVGDFDITIPVQTHDEIGTLSKSFNYMVRQIKARTTEIMESNVRLADAQRTAHIGNWEWDIVKNEVLWSDEIYRIFGLIPQEFGATWEAFLNCVHPDDREFVKKSVDDVLYEKKPYDIEHRILLKNATVRIVHERAVVAFDETGKAIRMIGTVQDITERKQGGKGINLLQTIILGISMSGNLHEAMIFIMKEVCNATGWVYGEAWYPNQDRMFLQRDHTYYSSIDGLEKFSTFTEGFTFSEGMGLPGRAWSTKRPVWVSDVTCDPQYLRAAVAKEVGLKTGVAFPVIVDNEVVTVVVFYKFKVEEQDGRLVKLVSTVMAQLGSIIKRKQVEGALRESEEKLKSILDNATTVIYVKDIQGKYTFINRQFEKLFHIKGDEIKGKTDYDVWSRELADVFRANDLKTIEAKCPLSFDEIASHDDGLHTYISLKFPLFNRDGAIYAVCGISTDITERRRMEEQLRKLSHAVEQSPNIVIITDVNGNIQYVNPKFTQLTGYTPEEVIGKNPRILKSDKTPPGNFKRLWDTITHGGEWRGEFINKKKNGELYWETVCISPIRNAEGVITNFLGVAEDITRIKQEMEEKENLREQLYHAQRLESVGRLAGGIAHDFNNIMTAIIGYGSLLHLDMKKDDSSRDYVQKILTSAERAAKLTQGLLAFSRKQVTKPEPVNLNEIIKRAGSLLSRLIGEDVELKTMLTDKNCIIMADSSQIEQILMNLATNAKDAMPDGGILTISTDSVELDDEFKGTHDCGEIGNHVLMTVSDTGTGMDEEMKERIFEPFFTTKGLGKGTGLGLAIVYGIVKQHQGCIDVSSESGKGTTFKIYLPIIESAAEKVKSETRTIPKGGTETILLAEDEADVRKLIKTIFEGYGYKVIDTVDGEDMINKFMENKDTIHLLVSDVIMPKKNGKEAYDEIRRIRPGIKVLFMSGYSEDIISKKMILKEGLNFISKPVSPTELLRKVREVLDK